ncbi:MAG TPA: hypothetical protein VMT16_10855 [Thermoanaerobaculia bacterium]|nr:hypothetical protein [Thermoanaerobaculia bacterium]
MRRRSLPLALLAFLLLAGSGFGEETRVTVRTLSRDAKFIGTSMGGARVTITESETGRLLAEGVTRGGTGDTLRILGDGRARGASLATPEAAAFAATLDIERATLVEIRAFGPLAQRQAAVSASRSLWLLPGKHLDAGDGVVLELAGFAVDVLSPPAHSRLPRQEVEVRVNLVML